MNDNYITAERDVLGSRDLLKFWEISDIISVSETVQGRDMVAMEV